MTQCQSPRADGQPCESVLAGADGFCPVHSPECRERFRVAQSLGGQATAAKFAGAAFTAEEVTALATIDDAKLALDQIRIAAMTRRLTHAEANAASKAVAEWVKADSAAQTDRVVNELTRTIDAQKDEIDALRQQIAGQSRTMRVAK